MKDPSNRAAGEQSAAARRALAETKLEKAIHEVVSSAPELSADAKRCLTGLLGGGA